MVYINLINFFFIAQRALNILNFEKINGKPCRIMWSQRDPTMRHNNKGNLFVKNLAPQIDSKELYDTFSLLGNILSCKVATDENGKSKGYGFVHFETEEMAQEAIKQLNDIDIEGKKIYVGPFVSRENRPNTAAWTNCYFKNIPEDWDENKFIEFFKKAGEVTSLYLPKNEETGKNRGFGFANFKTHEQAEKAVNELHDKVTLSEGAQPLYIRKALSKNERMKEIRQQSQKQKQEFLSKIQGKNLYVKNIGSDYDEAKLRQDFEQFGTITSARIMKDDTGNSKCFGFVCFETSEQANAAISGMNGQQMSNGKPMYVALAQRKEVRRAQLSQQHSQQRMMMPPQFYPPPYGYPMMPRGAAGPIYPPNGMYPPPPNMNAAAVAAAAARGGMQRGGPYMGYPPAGAAGPRGPMMPPPPQQQGGMNRGPQQGQGRGGMPGQPPMMHPGMVPPPQQQGGPRGPMVMQGQPQQQQQQQRQSLSQSLIAGARNVDEQKNALGEYLYQSVSKTQPDKAPKITGMLLEMEVPEILLMIDTPAMLENKIQEALNVLNESK